MIHHYDVVVVGAGIFGSAAAYNCQKNGLNTLLIEQFDLKHHRGSSHGKSRITRFAHADAPYIPLVADSYKIIEDLENVRSEKLWRRTGLVWSAPKERALEISKALSKHNQQHEVLKGSDVSKKYPQFQFDDSTYAVVDPKAGILFADKILNAFQEEFIRLGGRVKEREELLTYKDGTSRVQIKTDKNMYSADKLIFTAGTWMGKLIPQFNEACQVKTQSLTVCYWGPKDRKQAKLLEMGSFPCYIGEQPGYELIYGLPAVDHEQAVKVTYGRSPTKSFTSFFGQDYVVGEEHPQSEKKYLSEPAKFISQYVPVLDPSKPTAIERCKYTVSGDAHYVVDWLPGSNRILLAGCGSGAGFKNAPGIGHALAQMAKGQQTSVDMSFFSLKRFKNSAKL